MSNFHALLAREEAKKIRQQDSVEATELEIELLGENAYRKNKLLRQQEALKVTNANIRKIEKAMK